MGKGERPEHTSPPEIFYNDEEAQKYTTSSRIIQIQVSIDDFYGDPACGAAICMHGTGSSRIRELQAALTERALELLALPNDGVPKLLLDLGCGSGLSGDAISEHGHYWLVRSSHPL